MKMKILFICMLFCLAACTTAEQHFNLAQDIMAQDKDLTSEEQAQIIYHLEQAAKVDNAQACYDLANAWLQLDNRDSKAQEAFVHWLTKAAQLGLPQAQYELGIFHLHQYNPQEGLAWLEKAAQSGNPEWQFSLSRYYYSSSYVPQRNLDRSFHWALEAARQGLAEAQNHVGYCYATGTGVAKNSQQAFNWITTAAQAGYPIAQNNLAISYELGLGAAVDYDKAIYWYEQAMQGNLIDAYTNLAVFYVYMAPKPYYNPEKGFALLEYAVEHDDVRAMSVMGECYQFGVGIKRDLQKALHWQTASHQGGYYLASYYLGRMYLEGIGVTPDAKLAYQLFLESADKESWGGAACALGDMYLNGKSNKGKDYERAINWYTRAARQNNQRAMYQLGHMYENGLGVSKNPHTALGWYEKALSLTPDELRASYAEQSLSKQDPVAKTTSLAKSAVARLSNK